jgi:hypothetical protein
MTENNKLIAEFMQPSFNGFGTYDFDGQLLTTKELKFHSDWNWLMPVIDKCYQEHMSKHIADAVMTCDKDKAYQAVVEFIKWYNNNN